MKVIYTGRRSSRSGLPAIAAAAGDVIELFENNWDDYGNKTLFAVKARFGTEEVDLDAVKLMVEGDLTSSAFLSRLLAEGWSGEFPLPRGNYLSTPTDIAFYADIAARRDLAVAKTVAEALRDASYLVRIDEDGNAIALTETAPFRNSLQREQGAVKAFLDGWKIFANQSFQVDDVAFHFLNAKHNRSVIHLRYNSPIGLPDDINVLVGPNGVGKSRLLHQIVNAWIERDEGAELFEHFERPPNIIRLIVVSYSPFEQFPVDLLGRKIRDTAAYRYFGLRERSKSQKSAGSTITLSYDVPAEKAAASLISCINDDRRFSALPDWGQKLPTMERVLGAAFTFDTIAVSVPLGTKAEDLYLPGFDAPVRLVDKYGEDGAIVGLYAPITDTILPLIKTEQLLRATQANHGIAFLKDGVPIALSSGQQLFSYIVINILGALRRDSLVLIDEPELFLHPTLEIQFIEMLKEILRAFNSKALLATHSEIIVREAPADCVHVMQAVDDDIVISHPPFQTFGGDVQRISSYVFGDNVATKPFERWIERKLKTMSPQDLIASLGDQINEELIIQIRAMAKS